MPGKAEAAELLLMLSGAIKLPGIIDVVPYAVEAADYGGFRGHEGISHPDGEDGVLLAQRLACRNLTDLTATLLDLRIHIRSARLIARADIPSCKELEAAAHQ